MRLSQKPMPAKQRFIPPIKPLHAGFAAVFLSCLMTVPARAAFDVTISNLATSGGSFVNRVWTPTSSPSRIHVNDLLAELENGNVTINTAGLALQSGVITLSQALPFDNLTVTKPRTLTLNAQGNAQIGAALQQNAAGGDNVPNLVNVQINAGLSGSGGDVTLQAAIDTAGGFFNVSGRDLSCASDVGTAGGSIALSLTGAPDPDSGSFFTSGGSFTCVSAGGTFGSPVTSSGGNISLSASGSLTVPFTLNASGGANVGSVGVLSGGGSLTTSIFASITAGTAGTVTLSAATGLTVNGDVSGATLDLDVTGSGNLQINGTAALYCASAARFDTANGTITVSAGASIANGASGSMFFHGKGAAGDLTLSVPLTAGSGGLILRADDDVFIQAAMVSGGLMEIKGDANLGGAGNANIAANLTSSGTLSIFAANVNQTAGTIFSNGSPVTVGGGGVTLADQVHTGGGAFSLSSASFNTGIINTSGGAASLTGVTSGVFSSHVTTSGGNLTASVSGASGVLSNAFGADLNVSGGAGVGGLSLSAPAGSVAMGGGRLIAFGGAIGITARLSSTIGCSIDSSGSVTLSLTGPSALLTLSNTIRAGGLGNALTARSSSGAVTVAATASLEVAGSGNLLIESGELLGDVAIHGSVTSGTGGITLRSMDTVLIDAPVTTDGGNITIQANHDAGGAGNAELSARISSGGGAVEISGVNIVLSDEVFTSGGAFTSSATGTTSLALGAGVFTNGRNLTLGSAGAVSLSGNLDATFGAGMGGVSCTCGGALALTATGKITAGGDVTLTSSSGVSLDGWVDPRANIDIDSGNGSITLGAASILSNQGAAISLDTGNGSITITPGATITPGPASKLHLQTRGDQKHLTTPISLGSGSGGIELYSDENVTVQGTLSTTGPITILGDLDSDTQGSVSVTANLNATGSGDVTVNGRSVGLQKITTAGGSIHVTNSGTACVFGGNLTTGGGQLGIVSASNPTYPAAVVFSLGGTGGFSLSVSGGSLTIPPLLDISSAASISLNATHPAGDLTVSRALASGAGGITLLAADQVTVGSPLSTSGPMLLRADSDASGAGSLAVDAALQGGGGSVSLSGSGVTVNQSIDTTTGLIDLKPLAGTTAVVSANLLGPVRLASGITRFTTGGVTAQSLKVVKEAILEFDHSSRSLSPASFENSTSPGETRIRIGGTAAGGFNRILSAGLFIAGGTLKILLDTGFTPVAGDSFDLFNAAGFTGGWTALDLPPLPSPLQWDTSDLATTGTLAVISPTPIEQWRMLHFGSFANSGDGADGIDFDHDGLPNLLEYALDGNPRTPGTSERPQLGKVTVGSNEYPTLTIVRPLSATDVAYRFQSGDRPDDFKNGSRYAADGDTPTNAHTTEVLRAPHGGGREIITVRDNVPLGGASSRFMRLEVTGS